MAAPFVSEHDREQDNMNKVRIVCGSTSTLFFSLFLLISMASNPQSQHGELFYLLAAQSVRAPPVR